MQTKTGPTPCPYTDRQTDSYRLTQVGRLTATDSHTQAYRQTAAICSQTERQAQSEIVHHLEAILSGSRSRVLPVPWKGARCSSGQ